ncbi:HD domain-containing protein [Thermodesulforhabdus norvegica]|uniref:HD domain-containing protein n=1 Tax=Thermodesulforhabdus norvegica TaxID=39841 RepID=A0A1I4UHF9_9BACT|nr:HD domain-containing protein [Thermodesulforhabdus norvegica]SFM88422.1 HD domain-containing protein [Thermodesulforhabdus norvegica]
MWKQEILSFVEKFEHPAWGVSHFKRVYELSLHLAELQGMKVDEECLFAAAYLHDIGAFEPYKQSGVDHAERSALIADEILASVGFPMEKTPLVKEIIRGHMFYVDPVDRNEVILFHDADTLEFMGWVGIARLLSIVGLDDWTPDLASAVKLIERFSRELPDRLYTPQAKEMGQTRQAEMLIFLTGLSDETSGLETL